MCGRYRLSRRKQVIDEYFAAEPSDLGWEPRYNIAPSQSILTIRYRPEYATRRSSLMQWGLIPSWSKGPSPGSILINVRSETAAFKPAFRDPLRLRRCLIPADGFYEWQKVSNAKQPFCFEVGTGEVFAFAGLWDQWKSANGELVESCSILTTTPNPVIADIHNRMPVILRKDDYDLWLDPKMRNLTAIGELLKPFDASRMRRYPVSSRLNAVQNDDEACAAPVQLTPYPEQTLLL
jgi:putative SOS response-associated peptidase YedK